MSKSRTPTRFDRKTPTASVADESEFTPEKYVIHRDAEAAKTHTSLTTLLALAFSAARRTKISFATASNSITGRIVRCYADVKSAIKCVSPTSIATSHPALSLAQVVEIGIYIDHLLRECEKKVKYQQCSRCTEAIGSDYDVHIKIKECHEAEPHTNRCPFCHMNIAEGDEPWRDHLMGPDGCVRNPRRMPALKNSKERSTGAMDDHALSVHAVDKHPSTQREQKSVGAAQGNAMKKGSTSGPKKQSTTVK